MMSMNRYMHPRNIYKQQPDFKRLAIDYPEFRQYVKQDATGKVTIDFKDVNALRALTCTLLKKDFDITLDLPSDKLIPTVPLRLNYILWIEDLLSLIPSDDNNVDIVKGIDIGTGASCIYPLLCASKNGWSMLASETDPVSVEWARKNVSINNFQSLIQIAHVQGDTLIRELLSSITPNKYKFCMCNPPFFAQHDEDQPLLMKRRPGRPPPRNAFCGTPHEVTTSGGEVAFVQQLITESLDHKTDITIFTTMLGHKSSMTPLKHKLREVGVAAFKHTEFCQGHTTRWGLAWTFVDLNLRQIPNTIIHPQKPLVYHLPDEVKAHYQFAPESIANAVHSLLIALEMETDRPKLLQSNVYTIRAQTIKDTWSHQRRLRRELLRNTQNANDEEVDPCQKRCLDQETPNTNFDMKRLKRCLDEKNLLLEFHILVRAENDNITLECFYISGKCGKDGVNQVLQYIKNNLLKPDETV